MIVFEEIQVDHRLESESGLLGVCYRFLFYFILFHFPFLVANEIL